MSEEETLGRVAYEAYCKSKYVNPDYVMTWEQLRSWQLNWIDAAKAVAERVIAEMQTGVEASE